MVEEMGLKGHERDEVMDGQSARVGLHEAEDGMHRTTARTRPTTTMTTRVRVSYPRVPVLLLVGALSWADGNCCKTCSAFATREWTRHLGFGLI